MGDVVHEPGSPTAPLRVLVVDDDPDVREIVAFQVGLLGHVVVEAADRSAALATIDGGGLDVVVTDLDLAGEDGHEVVRAASEAGLPAVGMTGAASVALAASDFPVLRKPVDLNELGAVLAAAVE